MMFSGVEKAEVPGYTVMKHATGGPERIVTEDMEFTGLDRMHNYFL